MKGDGGEEKMEEGEGEGEGGEEGRMSSFRAFGAGAGAELTNGQNQCMPTNISTRLAI